MSHQELAIRSGDVHRTSWPATTTKPLPLYQGSGRSGACWNAWGLMNPSSPDHSADQATVWSHADHWHRGNHGMDAWLHVGRLLWAQQPPPPPAEYEQSLTLLDGRLTTRYRGASGRYQFCSYFDPGNPDLLAFEIEYDFASEFPSILFEPVVAQDSGFIGSVSGSAQTIEEGSGWRMIRLKVGTADSRVAIRIFDLEGASSFIAQPNGIQIKFSSRGRHLIVLGTVRAERESELKTTLTSLAPTRFANDAAGHWRKRWGAGWINVPDANAQALWARSHYYVLASYGADVRAPAPPMGWAGSGWPYGFPQDLAYISPALLRLGHVDIAQAWVEFYARTIPSMQDMTKRIYGAEGIMWAWEFPIGEQSRLFVDGVPNKYTYEIHNAAYPARMAYETALHLGDPAWFREFAWPVIRESARFYASTLRKAPDGLWDLRVTPSMGQDELDDDGGSNYLCSLYSARYALDAGVRAARQLCLDGDESGKWHLILSDGLAFSRLFDPKTRLYATREGIDASSFLGKQKHPIQLNPLYCAPSRGMDEALRTAARRRRDLCIGVGKQASQGWTLPAYMLAAAHADDGEGFLSDLHLIASDKIIDPDWLQIYESAPARGPYYITSHGFYLQALQDIFVSDFSGGVEFGIGCPREWSTATFGGLHTYDGNTWSKQQNGADRAIVRE